MQRVQCLRLCVTVQMATAHVTQGPVGTERVRGALVTRIREKPVSSWKERQTPTHEAGCARLLSAGLSLEP